MAAETMDQGLSRDELLALKNRRTGVLMFQISWIMVFLCLIVANLQLRGNFASWPPVGVAALDRILPTIATVALLASAFAARAALRAIASDARQPFFRNWQIAIALGAVFLAIMVYEGIISGSTGQYSAIFRVMVAYHAIHAVVIGYLMIRAWNTARLGGYDSVRYWGVEAAAKLWYFVVIAWVLFYVVLYVI